MNTSVYKEIHANKNRTLLIMVFFTLFISTVAFVIGKISGYGWSWAGIALIISGVTSLSSYYWGDKLVLNLSHAQPADKNKDFDLYTVTENLAIAAGIPKPKVYIIEDSAPNAFATGRSPQNASICVTRGLIGKLKRRELEGVIAHELSHIRNFDTRLLAIVTVLVGTLAFLSDWFARTLWWGGRRDRENRDSVGAVVYLIGIVLAIIAPFIATLIQLAISRRREFLADASGVLLTRNPPALAQALEKIASDREMLKSANTATAHLYIVNPFKGKKFKVWFTNLFNTHPPIEERIRILKAM